MKPFHCLAGLALAAGLAASAQAKVLIHHVHLGNFTFNTAEAAVPIEVNNNGTGAYGQWTRASITMPVFLIAGTHEIHIKARLNSGATGAWLGDSVTTLSQ